MPKLAAHSYKFQQDKKLLESVRRAIFVLKLHEQGALTENGIDESEVALQIARLQSIFKQLEETVQYLNSTKSTQNLNLSYVGLARRFIDVNPADVDDRLRMYSHISLKLASNLRLQERDFVTLDKLQSLLESEVAESVQDLYRF